MDDGNIVAAQAPIARRVLIILLGAIGDVVRALPLLGRLRKAYPNAHVAWAVEPKSEPLLRGHPWLDELIIYDRSRAPIAFLPFLYRVRAGRFDLVLDLQRHLKSGLVAYISGAPRRIGFASANTKEFNHWFSTHQAAPQPNLRLKLLQYQSFGDALGLPPAPVEFGLEPTPAEMARAGRLIGDAARPLLGVILGSSWESRTYFPEMTAEVIAELHRRHGLTPILLGGSDDRDLAAAVIHRTQGMALVDLVGRTGLKDLPGIFRSCIAAFGPDCGPMHIAAAVGCPVVSLWGATAPERSAPWGFADLAIKAPIPCHPCYLRKCPIERECMRRIDPAQIVDAIQRARGAAQLAVP